MAQTSYLQLDLLEVGQKEKEATINGNMTKLDQKVPRYLGDLASDPTSPAPAGSTYYNTATAKMRFLRANNTWTDAA